MKVSWRYVAEPPPAERAFPPAAHVDVRLTGNDIYRAASGRVSDGVLVHDVAGEVVKVLHDTCTAPWAYTNVDVVVRLPGDFVEALKPGTKLAVLPPNYEEQLRDARRSGPEESARADGEESGG